MAFIPKDKEANFSIPRYCRHDCYRIRDYIFTLGEMVGDKHLLRHGWAVENCIRAYPDEYTSINTKQYYFVTEEDFPILEKAVGSLPLHQFWKNENSHYFKMDWEVWNLLIPSKDSHWDNYYGISVIVLPTAQGFTNEFCKTQT